MSALAAMADERPTLANDGTVRAPMRRRSGVIAEAVRRLDDAAVGIDDISLRRPTLDDVFIALTGHAAEEEPAPEAAEEVQAA
jgi:ABC-2 type transport system ATP-binding protein